jgi:lipopolysaccharide transport system ATP-binding protein
MTNRNVALSVRGLSKQYRIGEVGTGTISHDLNRWWHKVRGKEDPYLNIGEENDRTSSSAASPYVWALRDIEFDVKEGNAFAIIGNNGAGKSTLLKVLSRVTSPTTGSIGYNGRIASLLEVGTGFHPELTGRENIYLNGTLLGMSGVSRYVDTPVKRYSSGMTVRLGFAVAAHLDPEILIIDEVLAVGDADFQSRCVSKMKSISQEGRTILFVSHNMNSVANLCSNGIVLDKGKVAKHSDNIDELISFYTANRELKVSADRLETIASEGVGDIRFAAAKLETSTGDVYHVSGQPVLCRLGLISRLDTNEEVDLRVIFVSESEFPITMAHNTADGHRIILRPGENEVNLSLAELNLGNGIYRIDVAVRCKGIIQDRIKGALQFEVKTSSFHQEIGYKPLRWFRGTYHNWGWNS